MVIRNLLFGLCLIVGSCTQKISPDANFQQATKPLSYYLPPAYDITVQEAQSWLSQHEYNRQGSYISKKQLNWELAEDFGHYIEVPFRRIYQGPSIKSLFNSNELAKLDQSQAEWYFIIGKNNNKYLSHIFEYLPFKEFSKSRGRTRQSLLECAKQRGAYSGLRLSFDCDGNFVSGVEVANGHGHIINISSQKFPSTELEEIKSEMYK